MITHHSALICSVLNSTNLTAEVCVLELSQGKGKLYKDMTLDTRLHALPDTSLQIASEILLCLKQGIKQGKLLWQADSCA